LLRYLCRNADAAGVGELLQACRNIDALAEAIVAFDDHLPQIDPDANCDALAFGDIRVALRHATLESDRAFDSVDNAAEFRQQTVSHQLEYAPMTLLDLGLEQLLTARPQPVEGPGLVRFHEGRVADDVDGQDGRKLAFHGKARYVSHR